ncbi:autotransporter outer membrane beta-barrel domain-containing protein [Microvirga pakistanensis]|uniref:autotransporter outer membrane beta-barrel domain-containing protein n=1 Tax=Microvirga pakistanensis TaxID=1682650 RepID=UPI00106DCC2A|nr:autotransporter outer membrane beta-barrel domain-containing protein [Microvirga pakistanensis]
MSLRQAGLCTFAFLSLGYGACEISYAADFPGAGTTVAAQRVTMPDGNVVSIWTDVSRILVEDERPLTASRGRAWQSTSGIDYTFDRAFSIGVGVSAAHAHTTEFAIPGRTETNSVIGFARATAYFLGNFNAGLIGGYGVGETDGSRLIQGNLDIYSRDTNVTFLGAHIGASFQNQGFFFNPAARILVSRSDSDPFQTSLGLGVLGLPDDFTRASFGSDVGYSFDVGGLTVKPAVRAFFIYDINLPKGYTDRTALDLAAVLNVQSGNLTGGVEALTTLGRTDMNSYIFRGFASYRF